MRGVGEREGDDAGRQRESSSWWGLLRKRLAPARASVLLAKANATQRFLRMPAGGGALEGGAVVVAEVGGAVAAADEGIGGGAGRALFNTNTSQRTKRTNEKNHKQRKQTESNQTSNQIKSKIKR